MALPTDFINKYQHLLGQKEANAFIQSFSKPARHGFRINPLKENRPRGVNLTNATEHCQFGYYGEVTGKTVDHQSGAVYSQEPSAMYVGEVAHPKQHERVLDLCAAPGGKTTHLGSYLQNTGLLIANEINSKRSKILVENTERFGLTNTIVTNTTPEVLAARLPNYFDRVLVDAPCSGEGMFRKDPDAMQYWNLDYPAECAKRQRTILKEAVKTLKPGGILVYSTCTFSPEEDEQIIAWLVKTYGFNLLPVKKFPGMDSGVPEWADGNSDLQNCVRIFPQHFSGEGHFIAKLQKPTSEPVPHQSSKHHRDVAINQNTQPMNAEERNLWTDFERQMLKKPIFGRLVTFKHDLYSVPEITPNLAGIKIVRLGLQIGTFKKSRFEPSYALGIALHPQDVIHPLAISYASWQKYVHGDTFSVDKSLKKGWYQLICEGQPVGFSKVVNGTAKNFFPKGLRFQAD